MNTLKPVRLKHAWQGWPKGHIFPTMPGAQAQHMIASGQVEYVEAVIEAAPIDRMLRSEMMQTKRRVGKGAML